MTVGSMPTESARIGMTDSSGCPSKGSTSPASSMSARARAARAGERSPRIVGRLVRLHFVQDVGQAIGGEDAGGVGRLGILQLLEHVGGGGDVEARQQGSLVVLRQVGEGLGPIGRAQADQGSDGLVDVVGLEGRADLVQGGVDVGRLHESPLTSSG